MFDPIDEELHHENHHDEINQRGKLTHIPVELIEISHANDEQQNHIVKAFATVTARQLKEIVSVELLEDAVFQFDELDRDK